MKEKVIKVVLVRPGEIAVESEVVNELEKLQEAVSEGAPYRGLIECLNISDGVDIICNEEGKLIPLKPCRRVEPFDIIAGTFLIVGVNEESGEFISLTDEQISRYIERFKEPEDISEQEMLNSISVRFVPF